MFLFHFFRSFLPLHNTIGFGAADFVELGWAAALVALALLWRPWIAPTAARLAFRTGWCMLLLALLPIALRLALLPHHPVPTPDLYDEFGHLLVADTLRHFRLANPSHPFPQFFETFFVLQEPTYSSIYPVGQGMALALGRLIFGQPWAGILLSTGAFCSLCYWMLRGWTTPALALLGGALAVIQFGPLNQWTNSYWGGAIPAAAGCLVFGALPRLRERANRRDAALLGAGFAVHMVTRQFESIFLLIAVILFFVPVLRRPEELRALARVAVFAVLAVLPAIGITLLQNKQVTRSWKVVPEMLSQYQYGVPAALTFQQDPIPHRELTPQQELGYKMQLSFRGPGPDTLKKYLERLEYRVRYYRFFFLPPLYLALLAFLISIRGYRFVWVFLAALVFAMGVNLFPAFQFHYIAAVACLFILMGVKGLEYLSRFADGQASRLIIFFCVAHFAFWYGLHLFEPEDIAQAMRPFESWDAINHGNPERRIFVNRQLAEIHGKIVVFVRYFPQHTFQDEWVYNEADIENARVVIARDLGPLENSKLLELYGDRSPWLLEPDFRPPRLTPYR